MSNNKYGRAREQFCAYYRVHEANLGRAPPGVRLGVAIFESCEAGSPREGDVANVGGAGGGEALIDHQRPLPQLRPLLTLGLPELLEFLHNVT